MQQYMKIKDFSQNTFSWGNHFFFRHRDFLFWDFLFWHFLLYFGHFKDMVLIFRTTKSKFHRQRHQKQSRHRDIKHKSLNNRRLKGSSGFKREDVPLAGGASFFWTGTGIFSSGTFFGTLKILGILVN